MLTTDVISQPSKKSTTFDNVKPANTTIPDGQPMSLVDLITILAVVIGWGLAFPAMKAVVAAFPSELSAGARFCLSGLALIAYAAYSGKLKVLTGKDYVKFAIIGLFQTTILFGIMFFAIRHVSAGLSSLLANTHPFVSVVLAHYIINERITRQKILGLSLGFSGVLVLVLLGKGVGELDLFSVGLMLTAGFAWGTGNVLTKKFQFKDAVPLAAFQMFFGSLPLLFIGFFIEKEPFNPNLEAILWFIYLTTFAGIFAWYMWAKLLQKYSSGRVAAFSFLTPVCGVLTGALLLGENLGINILLGGPLVALGIYVVNRRRKVTKLAATTTTISEGDASPPPATIEPELKSK